MEHQANRIDTKPDGDIDIDESGETTELDSGSHRSPQPLIETAH
jgi:hypothetical protein